MSTTVDQADGRQLREVLLPATRSLLTAGLAPPRPIAPDSLLRAVSQLDQLEAFIAADIPIFERVCLRISTTPLNDAHRQTECLNAWHCGIPLVDWISTWNWLTSLPDDGGRAAALLPRYHALLSSVGPRYLAGMTQLATAWLSPRFAGEPRNEIRKRVADLRPAYESAELIELMGKNTEGMLTPVERNEFLRLHKFFEMLQDIVDTALYPNPAES